MLHPARILNNTVRHQARVYLQSSQIALIQEKMEHYLITHQLDPSISAEGATGGVFRVKNRIIIEKKNYFTIFHLSLLSII